MKVPEECPMDPMLPGIRSVSKKHHYLSGGVSRFAWVTVGRIDGNSDAAAIAEPLFVLNGDAMKQLSDDDLAVMESVRTGISDAEQEFDWRGNSHLLIQVQGLLADGIDAKAAKIAAAEATKELIGTSS